MIYTAIRDQTCGKALASFGKRRESVYVHFSLASSSVFERDRVRAAVAARRTVARRVVLQLTKVIAAREKMLLMEAPRRGIAPEAVGWHARH